MPLAMPSSADLDAMGGRLAEARRAGTLAPDVDLSGLGDVDAAEDLRDAAVMSLSWA